MNNPTYIDVILQRIQNKQIAHRYNKGMNPHEIATEMNISEDYVKELFESWKKSSLACEAK